MPIAYAVCDIESQCQAVATIFDDLMMCLQSAVSAFSETSQGPFKGILRQTVTSGGAVQFLNI